MRKFFSLMSGEGACRLVHRLQLPRLRLNHELPYSVYAEFLLILIVALTSFILQLAQH